LKRRGYVFLTVLFAALFILVMLFGIIALLRRGLFSAAGLESRTAALYAAEAGVARALYELEENSPFKGELKETLPGSRGSFSVAAVRVKGSQDVIITSTGESGPFKRKVEVLARPGAGSYFALCAGGPVLLQGETFVNGIESLENPLPAPGGVYSGFQGGGAVTVSPPGAARISGPVMAAGRISGVAAPGQAAEKQARPLPERQDITALKSRPCAVSNIPPSGIVSHDTRIKGNLEVKGLLTMEKYSLLHVTGDLVLSGGVAGSGTIVADGSVTIKGTARVYPENTRGVAVFAGRDVNVEGPWGRDRSLDMVGLYFARMPGGALHFISRDLPSSAPANGGFFRWYVNGCRGDDPHFRRWRNGDPENPEASPGLPRQVREWLDESPPLAEKIERWQKSQ
jgi:hypothetical protein